jgi:Leucine-rich repeat (LRR) protein
MGLYSIPSLERFVLLRELNIGNNYLSVLPEFPSSLKHLNCSDNNIIEVFILPPELETFNCNNNLITKIHMIPDTLDTLECRHNFLRTLPSLKRVANLECDNNELWHIPKPNVLEYISCKNNSENVSEYNERTIIMDRLNKKILDVEKPLYQENFESHTIAY